VIVTELQITGDFLPVKTELCAHGLPNRLERFESGAARGGLNGDALRSAMVHGEEDRRRLMGVNYSCRSSCLTKESYR
jgi:hypothetical protein